MKHISVYVPQSAYMEAITPAYRLFNAANDLAQTMGQAPMFEVEFVGLEKSIKAQKGEYTTHVDRLLSEVEDTDLIVIPALCGELPGAVEKNREAIPWILQMHDRGAEVASLCLGAFLLGATGLLNGKKCSTHWAYYNEFRDLYPDIEIVDGSIITDEGKIYSSGGANSLWNLLLYLLEKYTDRDLAILAAKFFAIDIDRDNQRAFTIFRGQKGHPDNEIRGIQDYIENNYAEKLSILDLADIANVSRRSFERRFKTATNNTINEYVRRVRIEAAKRSFEASRKNVTEVMFDVGYTDTKAFRDVFKKVTGLTPVEYRNKYSKES
ncbi:GlxA family transcriptional regulator [Dyadobacter sp. CY323]|uniref:GlxA family transcriptional regulator n=1 Tax=Dyadobacter sp. CY323 TaxID=2907302 RepID=UPI001F283014|nr:helix-turn-helix domain-containing protein [Dyadobacter sp. CY323]MCE6992654.1 helix-turn-helix domain-containing protein [Dyadobacter sp. CY323]